MNLKELIQSAARLNYTAAPNVVIGNNNQSIIQFLEAAEFTGRYLAEKYNWQRLKKHYVFETTASITRTGDVSAAGVITSLSSTSDLSVGMKVTGTGIQTHAEISSVDSSTQVTLNLSATADTNISLTFKTQDYAFPSDLDHLEEDTFWDRSNLWENIGPISDQSWARLNNGITATGGQLSWQIVNNKLRLFPAPTEKTTQSFVYYSKNWILATGASIASKSSFTADTDEFIFTDNIMLMGTGMMYRSLSGIDNVEPAAFFDDLVNNARSRERPSSSISLTPRRATRLIDERNLPDTGYGS